MAAFILCFAASLELAEPHVRNCTFGATPGCATPPAANVVPAFSLAGSLHLLYIMIRKLFLALLLLGSLAARAQTLCNCPPPTAQQIASLCAAVYDGEAASNKDWDDVQWRFQEELWKIACATPGTDTKEQAKSKIQCMWNKYRESFRCHGYTGTRASEKNIAKFAIDIGRFEFIIAALKDYQLDLNFLDKDGKTVLDFATERKAELEQEMPRNESRIVEFQRTIGLLRKYGAKTRAELGR